MNINYSQIEENLVSEIKLTNIQAKIFLLVVTNGKMTGKQIAQKLKIPFNNALDN